MNNLLRWLGFSMAWMVWSADAQPTPVLYSSYNLTGQTLNNKVVFTALPNNSLYSDGSHVIAGTTITMQPVNGIGTTNLYPGDYTITIQGLYRSWVITVPYTNGLVNVASIPRLGTTGLDVFYWTNALSGVSAPVTINGLYPTAGSNTVMITNVLSGTVQISSTTDTNMAALLGDARYYSATNPAHYVDGTVTNGLASTDYVAHAITLLPTNQVPANVVTQGQAGVKLSTSATLQTGNFVQQGFPALTFQFNNPDGSTNTFNMTVNSGGYVFDHGLYSGSGFNGPLHGNADSATAAGVATKALTVDAGVTNQWQLDAASAAASAAAGALYTASNQTQVASNALAQLVVSNTAGVAMWNNKTGIITMASSDVTGALGFSPQPTNANLTALAATGKATNSAHADFATVATNANYATNAGNAATATTATTAATATTAQGFTSGAFVALSASGMVTQGQANIVLGPGVSATNSDGSTAFLIAGTGPYQLQIQTASALSQGPFSAPSFSIIGGSGSYNGPGYGITSLPATNLTGTVPLARLPSQVQTNSPAAGAGVTITTNAGVLTISATGGTATNALANTNGTAYGATMVNPTNIGGTFLGTATDGASNVFWSAGGVDYMSNSTTLAVSTVDASHNRQFPGSLTALGGVFDGNGNVRNGITNASTILWVSPTGNDSTAVKGDATHPWQHPEVAVTNAVPGDDVWLTAGVFYVSNRILMVTNTMFRGSGQNETTILNCYTNPSNSPIPLIRAVTRGVVSDMTITSLYQDRTHCQTPVGSHYNVGDHPVTNFWAERLRLFCSTDGFYLRQTNNYQWTIMDCYVESAWDALVSFGPGAGLTSQTFGVIDTEVWNCECRTNGFPGAGGFFGANDNYHGNMTNRFYNCTFGPGMGCVNVSTDLAVNDFELYHCTSLNTNSIFHPNGGTAWYNFYGCNIQPSQMDDSDEDYAGNYAFTYVLPPIAKPQSHYGPLPVQ